MDNPEQLIAEQRMNDQRTQCPECLGEGGFVCGHEPGEYLGERCDVCRGKGWVLTKEVR